MIVRNITFSADEELIDKARAVAQRNQRSLNDEFRDWLAKYASGGGERELSFLEMMDQLKQVKVERKYTREEMNERR
jgi:ribosomal protein L20